MDKTGFLKELKQYLAVLNEGEQKDILDEYAQHIDMKMERGMSESEAIRDFGDIGELATEILEAYHVNPQFGAKKHTRFTAMKEEIPVAEFAEKGRSFWSKGTGCLKKLCTGFGSGLLQIGHTLMKPFAHLREAWSSRKLSLHKPSERRPDRMAGTEQETGAVRIRRKKMFGEIPGMAVSSIRSLFWGAVGLAAWCIRWAWNAFMLIIIFIVGMMTLTCLFGLGMLAVLLLQGYPLAGVTVGCLGLVLCGGSLTIVALCLCRFRTGRRTAGHTDAGDADTDEGSGKEQQYMELEVQEVIEHA